MYETKFHRDGSVTVWDTHAQVWQRATAEDIYRDDRLMSTLNARERARVEAMVRGYPLSSQRRLAKALYRAAPEGGAIQAHEMMRFTRDPRLHTSMQLAAAIDALGVRYAAALEGLEVGD